VDAKTGKVIWQKWLGDPLMSQPAVWKGRVYIAYPANARGPQVQHPGVEKDERRARTSHRLICLDLKTGEPIWEQDITADVISAPVIADGNVYANCFDGTSFAFDAQTGALLWRKQLAGTSAPVIADGQLVMGKKEFRAGKTREGLTRVDPKRGNERDKDALAAGDAEYLEQGKGGGVALQKQATESLDSSVGFGTAPASAQLDAANKHIGVSTVVGGWAYQGSKASVNEGQMMNAQGRYINSVSTCDGKMKWRAEVTGKEVARNAQIFSPPALGREWMYLSGAAGHIVTVKQRTGEAGPAYAFGKAMVFQPALARGNVYVGTQDGWVICLKTGKADADGWYAWGGNAQHSR
jgi:outer membrane protein assembly factor BamB